MIDICACQSEKCAVDVPPVGGRQPMGVERRGRGREEEDCCDCARGARDANVGPGKWNAGGVNVLRVERCNMSLPGLQQQQQQQHGAAGQEAAPLNRVGKRFLCVLSSFTQAPELGRISEWDWRTGIIRAISHKDPANPDLVVSETNRDCFMVGSSA